MTLAHLTLVLGNQHQVVTMLLLRSRWLDQHAARQAATSTSR